MKILAWTLWVFACQVPQDRLCQVIEVYDQPSPYVCEFNRIVASSYWLARVDPMTMSVFTECRSEEEILIDNRPAAQERSVPEPPGKRGR